MLQRTIRLPEETHKHIDEAAGGGGFASPTAFIRYAIQQQLATGSPQRDRGEERLAANRIPEPSIDARSQAVARAGERYDRLLKTVGKALSGDAQAAIEELTAHVE